MTGTATFERNAVLVDRRRRGRLVRVGHVSERFVSVITIDGGGYVKRRARLRPMRHGEVEQRYQLYRPCRWRLHCMAQATVTVGHSSGDIDVCAEHAVEYREWLAAIEGVIHANWPDEPEPECWCPDDVTTGDPWGAVKYCPKDGTPQERGTELGELVPVSGGAGPVLEGPDRGKFPTGGPYLEDEG